ncbi:MAG: hypothetical protein II587_03450 [Oscillospiraceae bacterium]|nr:hypothetical protein [Oscillospiraceae bacterium]
MLDFQHGLHPSRSVFLYFNSIREKSLPTSGCAEKIWRNFAFTCLWIDDFGEVLAPGRGLLCPQRLEKRMHPRFFSFLKKKTVSSRQKEITFSAVCICPFAWCFVPLPPRAKELAPQGETFLFLALEAKTLLSLTSQCKAHGLSRARKNKLFT